MWPVAARDERFRSSLRSDCYSPENQLRKISAYPHKSSDENTLIGRCVECPGKRKTDFFQAIVERRFGWSTCFLCGRRLTERNRRDEHVFPKWLQKRFGLLDEKLTLLKSNHDSLQNAQPRVENASRARLTSAEPDRDTSWDQTPPPWCRLQSIPRVAPSLRRVTLHRECALTRCVA
jgi:hypothetical protein